MELIRSILEYAECKAANGKGVPFPEFKDYSDAKVSEHVTLCREAGYLEVASWGNITRLTWAGHEELVRLRASDTDP